MHFSTSKFVCAIVVMLYPKRRGGVGARSGGQVATASVGLPSARACAVRSNRAGPATTASPPQSRAAGCGAAGLVRKCPGDNAIHFTHFVDCRVAASGLRTAVSVLALQHRWQLLQASKTAGAATPSSVPAHLV